MSYTVNTWTTGEVITAEKLNNIENGISGASYNVITCETTGSGNDLTVTNAQALFDAVLDVERNPEKAFAFRLLFTGDMAIACTCHYMGGGDEGTEVDFADALSRVTVFKMLHDGGYSYFLGGVSVGMSDIDENGCITVTMG